MSTLRPHPFSLRQWQYAVAVADGLSFRKAAERCHVSQPSLSALRDAKVLLLDDGHCLRHQALAVCTEARAREQEFRATSLTTLAQMVAAGAGVTLLPQLAVATETARAALCTRPFADPPPYRTIALVWRKRSALAAALRQVAATIADAYPRPRRPDSVDPPPRGRVRPSPRTPRRRSA